MEGIHIEEMDCSGNVGSIAEAIDKNVLGHNDQSSIELMDSQEDHEPPPIPPLEENRKNPRLPKGCLPEDRELMQLVKGFKDGKMIEALYNATGIYGQGDLSAHDQTFCNKMAFYSGNNAAKIDRIFRSSKRYRPKWDELHGDLTYGQITINKAIAVTPDTYKSRKPNLSTGGGKKPDPTLEGLKEKYEVKQSYVDTLGKEEFIYPNLIIKNHILVIIAQSGGGKTTFLYFHVAPALAKAGYEVWYVDADSPPSDHKKMKEIADQYGFHFLIPDVNQGTSVQSLIEDIEAIAAKGDSLDKQVFFFDTLKKFNDVMNKRSTKDFFVLMRKLTKLGASVVLPGHANKHRGSDGNLIFEGVGDVKSDADDLIFFDRDKNADGSIDVTTVVDSDKGAKVRGMFEPFSFNISTERELSFYDKPLDPINRSKAGKPKATDDEIIQTAEDYLNGRTTPVIQSQLVDDISDMLSGKAGKNKIRTVILQRSVLKDEPMKLGTRLICTIGDKNSHYYELPESGPAQAEMDEE